MPMNMSFTDRKNSVIRRGENISAWEVENALLANPAVQIAAVYPVSAPHGEDEVAASVVLRSGSDGDPAQLTDQLRTTLLAHLVRGTSGVVSELPLTVSQKGDKTALRQRMQEKSKPTTEKHSSSCGCAPG